MQICSQRCVPFLLRLRVSIRMFARLLRLRLKLTLLPMAAPAIQAPDDAGAAVDDRCMRGAKQSHRGTTD